MKTALSLALLLAAAACAAAAPAAIEPFLVSFALDEQEPVIANETNFYHLKGFPGLTAKFNADDSCPEADGMTVEEILAAIGTPEFDANPNCTLYRTSKGAGAYYNHALYFATMGPINASSYEDDASAELKAAITDVYGGYDELVQAVNTTSATQWGPGFTWLCVMPETNELMLTTTPLQDNPLMANVVDMPCTPILTIDLYEHAYFLTYFSDRVQFTVDSFQVIDWAKVSAYYAEALKGTSPPVVNYVPPPPPAKLAPSPKVAPPKVAPSPSPEAATETVTAQSSSVCAGESTGVVDVAAAATAFAAYVDSGSTAYVKHDPAASGVKIVQYGGEASFEPKDGGEYTDVVCSVCCEIVVGADVSDLSLFSNGLGVSGISGDAISVAKLSLRTDGASTLSSDAVIGSPEGVDLTLSANGMSKLELTNTESTVASLTIPLADGASLIKYAGSVAGTPVIEYQGGAAQVLIGP